LLKLEMSSLTDVGRKRSANQDYLGDLIFTSNRFTPKQLDERGYLFAVADGMGGYAGGEVASKLTIETLFDFFYASVPTSDLSHDLVEAVRLANSRVHEEAQRSQRPQMGTTLTMMVLRNNRAVFANVGDSRIYLIRQGLAQRVTHDHSMIQEQIDAGILTPEQAEKSNFRNLITRAIGHRTDVEPELSESELMPGDVLLLCSDGLHGLVKDDEIGVMVGAESDLNKAAEELVATANERGGPDNISVLLVRVVETGEPVAAFLNGNGQTNISGRLNQATVPNGAANFATQPTVPNVAVPPAMTAFSNQPTTPMSTPYNPKASSPKPGGAGLLIGVLALVLVIVAVGAFIVLSGNSGSSTSTPTPITTPTTAVVATPTATVTTGPASTPGTVAPLPTVTPAPPTTPTTTVSSLSGSSPFPTAIALPTTR
jgi:PPM family protein phosphatase